ncbi:MAG: hypothetical protein Q8R53_00400 [Nanoarchaeota archaeon]|nr:hypothetical protein [Nanoarchaeota archaeon]
MSRKGAIGLSVELLVIIILGLVILGAGITFLYQLLGGASELKAELDTRTQQELERLLVDQGKQVALPRHTATILPGESHVFGLGILNTGSRGETFTLTVLLSKALDENEAVAYDDPDVPNEALRTASENWLLYNTAELRIAENEHRTEGILVDIPNDAPKGTYIYDVKVSVGGQPYGNKLKFTVVVK